MRRWFQCFAVTAAHIIQDDSVGLAMSRRGMEELVIAVIRRAAMELVGYVNAAAPTDEIEPFLMRVKLKYRLRESCILSQRTLQRQRPRESVRPEAQKRWGSPLHCRSGRRPR